MKIAKPIIALCICVVSSLLSGCVIGMGMLTIPQAIVPDRSQPSNTVPEFGSISPDLDGRLNALRDEGGMPGFTVGIVVEDELIWAKSYGGVAGIDTAYVIGSVTKPFTATAVLQLHERGQIDLDVDISSYLPFAVRHPRYPEDSISVRTLLTNQSGLAMDSEDYRRFQNSDHVLSDYVLELFGVDIPQLNLNPYPTKEEFFEDLLTPGGVYYTRAVWAKEPGEYQYSNIGYGLLAFIVERVSGSSFEEYLESHILEPLEMEHSGTTLTDLREYHAYPYQWIRGDYLRIPLRGIRPSQVCPFGDFRCATRNLTAPGGYIPVPDGLDEHLENGFLRFPLSENLVGSGGLRCSVTDLSSFLIAHMNDGLAPNGYQLLRPETVEMMHSIAARDSGSVNLIPLEGYGMGWTVARGGIQGHIGGATGYETEMLFTETQHGSAGILFMRNWSLELSDDRQAGFEFWMKYHVGVRELLMDEAERLLNESNI